MKRDDPIAVTGISAEQPRGVLPGKLALGLPEESTLVNGPYIRGP